MNRVRPSRQDDYEGSLALSRHTGERSKGDNGPGDPFTKPTMNARNLRGAAAYGAGPDRPLPAHLRHCLERAVPSIWRVCIRIGSGYLLQKLGMDEVSAPHPLGAGGCSAAAGCFIRRLICGDEGGSLWRGDDDPPDRRRATDAGGRRGQEGRS
jgi:hypothetical protein